MMTRQDFEVIAQSIKRTVDVAKANSAADQSRIEGVKMAVNAVSDACAASNPRFDRARFLTACGIN